MSPCHQAQPLITVWLLAGLSLLQRRQCHPFFSENWRSEQVGFCEHHGRRGRMRMRGQSVGSAILSATPSSALCSPPCFHYLSGLLSSQLKGQTLKPVSHPPSSLCAGGGGLPWCSSDVEEPSGSSRQVQFSTANIHPASPAGLRARPGDMRPATQPRAVPEQSSLTAGHRLETQGQCWTVCSREGVSRAPKSHCCMC